MRPTCHTTEAGRLTITADPIDKEFTVPLLSVDQLTELLNRIAATFPMNREERDSWVESCVLTELRGNIMQGLEHLGYHWFQRFTDGTTVWGAKPELVKETCAMGILDAHGAMGAYVAKRAMEIACERAKSSGVFTVAVRNSPDWMMVGYSTLQALRYDCVGLVMANSRPDVAPWGGSEARYGHCVISMALPASKHYPLLMDMACNNTGGLEAQRMLMEGKMPPGLYYDAEGNEAADPALWGTDNINWGIRGGSQRMSGYRDLALTACVDAFAGALTGMKCALDLAVPEPIIDRNRTPRGQVVMAFDVEQFTSVEEFKGKVDRAIDQAKSSRLASGFSEILMPGERGFREAERRRREGIPVPEKVWSDVSRLASARGVDISALIQP
jgi:LDH2 family malate/lactate/ureidoglycolate dehydrogenase